MFLKLENGFTFTLNDCGDDLQVISDHFGSYNEQWFSVYKDETFKTACKRKAKDIAERFESEIYFLN